MGIKLIVKKVIYITFFFVLGSITAQDFSAFTYRTVGPERGGRVTTVTGIPQIPGTFYLGASGAGVWKSDDYGVSWNNVSDGFFATPSIGAIEVAINDPNIVYVGTGSDGLRSNVIAGKGMYKSTDAGKTWDHMGLKKTGQIGAVEIDPRNHNTVWVAAIGNAFKSNEERGIYKSTDGGKNWNKVLYISDKVGFSDLELLPNNPDIVYAAAWKAVRKPWTIISGGNADEGGIYKSINGGKDWEKLGNGLPKGVIGKIDLAVSAVDSSILYAVIEAPGKEGGLYKSVNQGKSFVQVSDNIGLVNRPFYYTNVELDPTNPDIVFSNSNPLLKSVDGGKTWKTMSVPHGDNHDMWLNPNNPDLLIQCNDGGANVSHNGGRTWSTQFNQNTAELYQVEVDDQYPYWLYAGQQDNYTTISVPSFPPSAIQYNGVGWIMNTGGCETGPAVPKPGNANIVYANCKGRFSVFDKTTGTEKSYYVGASNIYGHNPKDLEYRFQRVAPIHVSPHNPDVVYHGSQYLHKTSDDGLTWETISPDLTAFEADKQVISGSPITRDITGEEYYSTLYSIQESTLKEGLIWTGANDGVISVTKDGGKSWNNVTPKKLPKGGRVESVAPSHFEEGKAFVVVDRHLLGDDKPYIYKTTNYGKSWELIATNGIPQDHTARVVREDPVRNGLLYAGTEYGLFISFDDGKNWQSFQQNLPITPITDLKIFRGDLIVSTMGRSFWILDNITALRDTNINQLTDKPVLFQPDTTIRYRYPKIRATKGAATYPRTSVIIDYYLPKGNTSPIQLEILDANKNVVVSMVSNKDLIPKVEEVEDMNLSQVFRYVDTKLTTKAGINRFNWNLRQKGAWHSKESRRFKYGPMVAPGKYTVKMTVDNTHFEQDFEIKMDPRVAKNGVSKTDIVNQIAMQQQVMDLLSKTRKLEAKLEKDKSEKAQRVLSKIKNDEGAYPQQMYAAQVSYLLNMISGTDQKIGGEAKKRFEELNKQFKTLQKALE